MSPASSNVTNIEKTPGVNSPWDTLYRSCGRGAGRSPLQGSNQEAVNCVSVSAHTPTSFSKAGRPSVLGRGTDFANKWHRKAPVSKQCLEKDNS